MKESHIASIHDMSKKELIQEVQAFKTLHLEMTEQSNALGAERDKYKSMLEHLLKEVPEDLKALELSQKEGKSVSAEALPKGYINDWFNHYCAELDGRKFLSIHGFEKLMKKEVEYRHLFQSKKPEAEVTDSMEVERDRDYAKLVSRIIEHAKNAKYEPYQEVLLKYIISELAIIKDKKI